MELINQHTKKIMEECKIRARDAGLSFRNETLEYIVTNRDMLELSPKVMIPTLYDYWLNDVEVIKNKTIYKVYPSNPYETVINSRPAISFYNDNNPDWLNIMIFYHVLGHIDFFQNNILYQKTWNDDFVGMALADKRLIAGLRTEKGRWVDYVIEFARSIDNLCGYFSGLMKYNYLDAGEPEPMIDYYFDIFLQEIQKVPEHVIFNEIQRYNKLLEIDSGVAESLFFAEIKMKHPEFLTFFQKYQNAGKKTKPDTMTYIMENSEFLKKEENHWMQSVLTIVRNTALYFEPQIRTKIINEGWASYWHDELFRSDNRISGHESAFAKINAYVTSINRIGLNPYAIGLRLIQHVEDIADKGLMNFNSQKIQNSEQHENINLKTGKGREAIFELRRNFSDFMMINTFTDQDFIDKHSLFTVGKRLNQQKRVYEYFIKSKKAEDYKKMLIDSLYHPPRIEVSEEKTTADNLYLFHHFEGKPLYREYIPETLIGIEFLWGGAVQLETTEIHRTKPDRSGEERPPELKKVLYTVKNRKVEKREI
jgi:stage V sporulation protein R